MHEVYGTEAVNVHPEQCTIEIQNPESMEITRP